MLLIPCPYCEMERPEIEFRYAGEAHIARPQEPSAGSDADFAEFLFMRTNAKGVHFERWFHVHGCGRYFNAARDTITDIIVTTYRAGEARPDVSALGTKGSQR